MNDNDGNVVVLNCSTTADVPPDRVLSAALGSLESVLVLGFTDDGVFYIASSTSKLSDNLWAVKCAEKVIMGYVDLDGDE